MRTNILFIVPPVISINELIDSNLPSKHLVTYLSIPMGVLSITSYVMKFCDAKIKILDLNIELSNLDTSLGNLEFDSFLHDCYAKLTINEPIDIVGISAVFNTNVGYLKPISDTARKTWPQSIIVAGGGLPTNMFDYVLKCAPEINAAAIGESERPFLGLVNSQNRLDYLSSALGWVARKNEGSQLPTMDLVSNLDEIPPLRFDLLDIKQYQKSSNFHGERQSNDLSVPVMSSRGCPFLCSFCASHTVHGKKLRYYSPERVLNDITELKEKYGVNIVFIWDDNFLVNKKNALKILDGLSKQSLRVEFSNGLSILHLDEDIINALKAAGLKSTTLAVESGCERILDEIIHKPFTKLVKVQKAVSLLRKNNIYIRAFFIIGFPGETKEEIHQSIKFMQETGFNWVAISIASPIVGSDLYDNCVKNNLLLSTKLEDSHYGKCNIQLEHSSPKELEEWRYLINLEVNFVNNYDMKHGFPELALIGFKDVLNRVPDHAFAHYFSALCYKKLGNNHLETKHMDEYKKSIIASSEWEGYSGKYNLQNPDPGFRQ